MASQDAIRFHNSTRSVADLTRLAERSAADAQSYLVEVKSALEGIGARDDAAVLDALVGAKDDLAGRIRAQADRLGLIFPTISVDGVDAIARDGVIAAADQPRLDPDLQRIAAQARAEGYIRLSVVNLRAMALTTAFDDLRTRRTTAALATPKEAPQQYLTGTVTTEKAFAGEEYKLVTPGGAEIRLADSEHQASYMPMPMKWLHGMIGDGPITLQGELGTDGTFQVEGFALNTDGAFDRFTFGRVRAEPGPDGVVTKVFISTSRGDAEVTDPTFLAKMKAMPRLGGIFPGETKVVDGKLVYDGNPRDFISLSRFTEQVVHPADKDNGRPWASTDMAYSVFRQKPVLLPEGAEARVNHGSRLWIRGDVVLGDDGLGARFAASYVSEATDQSWGEFQRTSADADPLEVAVMLAEAHSGGRL